MDIKKQVGPRIKTLRKNRGLTQEQLAALIDRSVDGISNLERGLSLPNFETLERLAVNLKVPIKAFFDFEEGETPIRAKLLTSLNDVARTLEDRELAMAVEQLEIIARHKNS